MPKVWLGQGGAGGMLMFGIDRRIITCTCKLYSFYGKAKEFIACTIHNVDFIFSVMPGWLFVNAVAGKRDYSNCAIKLLTMIFKMAKSALKSHLESNRIKKNYKRQASRAGRLRPQKKKERFFMYTSCWKSLGNTL